MEIMMWQRGNIICGSRRLSAWVALGVAVFLLGQDATLACERIDTAERLLSGGKYTEAAEIFEACLGNNLEDAKTVSATQRTSAALGLARCLAAEGKTSQARQVLKDSLAKIKDADGEKARLHAELALLALQQGDHATVDAHVEAAIGLDSDQLLARLLRAERFRLSGQIDQAHRAYAWLVKYHNNEQNDTFGEPESLRW
ncbi:unnamed protein product, partial [marine sediment metagenome]